MHQRSCLGGVGAYTTHPRPLIHQKRLPWRRGRARASPPASPHLVQKRGQGGPVPAIVIRQGPVTLLHVEADVWDGDLVEHLAIEVGEAHMPPFRHEPRSQAQAVPGVVSHTIEPYCS